MWSSHSYFYACMHKWKSQFCNSMIWSSAARKHEHIVVKSIRYCHCHQLLPLSNSLSHIWIVKFGEKTLHSFESCSNSISSINLLNSCIDQMKLGISIKWNRISICILILNRFRRFFFFCELFLARKLFYHLSVTFKRITVFVVESSFFLLILFQTLFNWVLHFHWMCAWFNTLNVNTPKRAS